MRIPIKLRDFSEPTGSFPPQLAKLASNEIVLIELQGSLEVEGDKHGEVIGTLKMENPEKPTLQIGHNLLEGQIVTLAKPLAVLELVGAESSTDSMEVDGGELSTDKSFEIIAIIRKKMSFPKRPRPIVLDPPPP